MCKFVITKPQLMILISFSLPPVLPFSLPQLRSAAAPGEKNARPDEENPPCHNTYILLIIGSSQLKGWVKRRRIFDFCNLLKPTAPILRMSSLTWTSLKTPLSSSFSILLFLLLPLNHFFWLERRAAVLRIYLWSHHWQLRQLWFKRLIPEFEHLLLVQNLLQIFDLTSPGSDVNLDWTTIRK